MVWANKMKETHARHGQQYGTASMGHYAENLFIGVANKLVPIAKPANPANPLKLDFYTREGVYLYIYIYILPSPVANYTLTCIIRQRIL